MNLDDFAAENRVEEEKEEEFDETEDSVEADLSNALNLLEDCYQVFDDIMNRKGRDPYRISPYNLNRVKDLSQEVLAFTAQYEDTNTKVEVVITDNNNNWKNDI